MKISRILFLSLSLLISVPVLSTGHKDDDKHIGKQEFIQNNDNPTGNAPSELKPTTETPKETPMETSTENSTPAPQQDPSTPTPISTPTLKPASAFTRIKDTITTQMDTSVEKVSALVVAAAGFSFVKNNFIGSTLTSYKNGISKFLILSAAATLLYGTYKAYQALTKEEEQDVIDFDYSYESDDVKYK